jgi:CheY-like chemotaxis protein
MPLVAVVVDDSMLIRYTVGQFLEERGYRVESASNGFEALEVLKKERVDLVVTDLQMPKMSGGELITALKSEGRTAQIPIVVLSGTASDLEGEQRANFAICKDIDIETQLAKALDCIQGATGKAGKKVRVQAAGK